MSARALALLVTVGGLVPHMALAQSPRVEAASPGKVNLYRDSFGMAHLYAAREEDGYFGLGYAIAEDRLKGVLLFYLALRGELAAAFGPGPLGDKPGISGISPVQLGDVVVSDIRARRARYLDDARENLARIDPQQRRNAQSFIAGMQAYMARHPDRVPAWAPKLEAALPLAAEGFLMIGVSGYPGACAAVTEAAGEKAISGSNIWAVTAARTTDGAAAFSSDSHGGYEFFGSMFYPARIKAGALDAWLLDIAGMPIGLKGHSRHFAWGWAEGPRFPADCIKVRIDPADPANYRIDGKSQRFERQPYVIDIKGREPLRGQFEYTAHNGVRSEVIRRDGETALAVSNAYSGREGFAGQQFGAMLRARDWAAMRTALGQLEIYPANIAMAGADGSILYMRPGRTPIRPAGTLPDATVDGSTSATAWQGLYPLDKLVQTFDPLQGYVTNENVSPDMMFAAPFFRPDDYSPDFAFVPGDTGTRQLRAIELLGGERKLGLDDLRAVVGDAMIYGSAHWGTALSRLRKAGPTEYDRDYAQFLDLLETFDGRFEPQSRAALYHATWRLALRERYASEVAEIERAIGRGRAPSAGEARILGEAARAAFDQLRAEPGGLDGTFGDRFRIGRGSVDLPARGMTLLPLPVVRSGETDFGSLWGANYSKRPDGRYQAQGQTRFPFLVQFTDPIRSYSATAYGISDDPASPHFSDQSQLMASGQLRSNFFERDELGANLATVVTLTTRSAKQKGSRR